MRKRLTKIFLHGIFKKISQIGDNMKKTKQLLAYIIQKHSFSSVTSLMKLSYIVDLVSIKKINKQISDFEYIRYKYGPFDNKIYNYIKNLLENKIISEDSAVTHTGEVIVYKFNKDCDFSFDKLIPSEINTIDEVLDTLKGYGPQALVDLAYKTNPMEKIGAKQDNEIGLNIKLDLRA